ncbi:MAG: hypothetical protein KIT15_10325 [Xanthobacteraceae bacterium]|nr:hypothetical protein [Xanthobacteraceae bacterium]
MTSRTELEEIASLAAKKTVEDLLLKLGIDHDEPIEMQKDFQHLRSWRQSSEQIRAKTVLTAIGILIAGLCGAVWLAIKGH